jgi:AraC-like DNA-binding protein
MVAPLARLPVVRWQRIQTSTLRRHVHRRGYAALVLSGEYEEAGDFGRFRVHAGEVVLHDAFEGHLDRFRAPGAVILNLPLPPGAPREGGPRRVDDLDRIVQLAEVDEVRAAALLLATARNVEPRCADWPDALAQDLLREPDLRLGAWSEARAIPPWTVCRGFVRTFGISPARYRARVRARHAWKLVQGTARPLATIAAELGFADQSHMTRSVAALTGQPPRNWRHPPRSWRQACKSVQDA